MLNRFGVQKDSGPQQFRWSRVGKPLTGGMAMSAPIFLFVLYMVGNTELSIWVFMYFLVCMLTGLYDDMYSMGPMFKFVIQMLCGLFAWMAGLQLEISGYLWLDLLITCFWSAGLMNSVNMLDNMDGVAAAAVFSVMLSALFWTRPDTGIYMLLGVITLSIAGFLIYNLYPSRMYMGDSGSHLLGALIFWFSLQTDWNGLQHYSPGFAMLISVYALMYFPFTDTLLVSVSRLLRGKSPFIGGRDHLTHMLVFGGMRQSRVPWLIIVCNLFYGFLVQYVHAGSLYMLGFVILLNLVFAGLYFYFWSARTSPE